MPELSKYKGRAVVAAGIELPGAAGGLRAAVKVDPQEYDQGDRVFIVIEATCQKQRYEPIDADVPKGPQRLVMIFKTEAATFVDEDLVREQLDKQKARIALAADDESGQQRTPTDAEFDLQHFAGQHAKRRKSGCPSCEREKELECDEKRAARAERAKATAAKKAGKVVDIRNGTKS